MHTNCMDITMAWKSCCKDVATRLGSFALHIIFCLGLGAVAPLPPQMTPLERGGRVGEEGRKIRKGEGRGKGRTGGAFREIKIYNYSPAYLLTLGPYLLSTITDNKKDQSNLAKGDTARLIMLYAKEILSISSIIFAWWQHASRSWSWRAFEIETIILGKRRS